MAEVTTKLFSQYFSGTSGDCTWTPSGSTQLIIFSTVPWGPIGGYVPCHCLKIWHHLFCSIFSHHGQMSSLTLQVLPNGHFSWILYYRYILIYVQMWRNIGQGFIEKMDFYTILSEKISFYSFFLHCYLKYNIFSEQPCWDTTEYVIHLWILIVTV